MTINSNITSRYKSTWQVQNPINGQVGVQEYGPSISCNMQAYTDMMFQQSYGISFDIHPSLQVTMEGHKLFDIIIKFVLHTAREIVLLLIKESSIGVVLQKHMELQ